MKNFGFWTLTFLVIANMIGAGVFTTSGFSLADLGAARLVVLAWGVGGVIALTGAFSYGLLAEAMPESGGEYLFLSRAAHPLLGFIAGWVSLIAGFSGAIAFAATAFESYLMPGEGRPAWLPTGTVAVSSIAIAGAFHGIKPRSGALIQNSVVVLKLGLLLGLLAFAAYRLSTGGWPAGLHDTRELSGWPLWSAFAGSLVWISLSYSGFNAAVYVAGEVDQARRVVPRALLAGTCVVTVLYLLLNAVFVYASSAESIAGKEDVAAIAARSLGGAPLEAFVRWTIAICLLTSVFSMMMAAPRVYAKMADDGLLPARLQFASGRPLAATLVQVVVAVGLVLVSNLQGLLSYLGLTLSISAACSVCCLFLPTVRTGSLLRPVYLLPATYVTCTVGAAVLMVSNDPRQLLGTALTFAVGVVAFALVRRRKASRSAEPDKRRSAF